MRKIQTENFELRHSCSDLHNWIFIESWEGGLHLWFSECLIPRYTCSSVTGSTVLSTCVFAHWMHLMLHEPMFYYADPTLAIGNIEVKKGQERGTLLSHCLPTISHSINSRSPHILCSAYVPTAMVTGYWGINSVSTI